MTTIAQVSIDRSSLSLGALVISSTPTDTYVLTGAGLGRPGISWRYTYAPANPYIHGSALLGAVKDQSSLPLEVLVQSNTAANLDAAIKTLTDALDQFSYDVTVTVDGVAKTWSCDPGSYASTDGQVNDARQVQFVEVLAITIPVYPIPG